MQHSILISGPNYFSVLKWGDITFYLFGEGHHLPGEKSARLHTRTCIVTE